MTHPLARFLPARVWPVHGISAALLASIAACGGGGGGDVSGPQPTVSSVSTGAAKYSQTLQITVTGANLDQGLNVTSSACKGMTKLSTAPMASTASTAYYQCTVSAVGAAQVQALRSTDAAVLGSAAFNVLMPQVTMTVSNGAAVNGTIVFTLSPDKTPVTVDNFLAYVNAKFYDGTAFHRLSPGFVLQGGGYAAPLTSASAAPKATNPAIALEVDRGLYNQQWTIAMARSSPANSATSQFFINLVDNSAMLDPSALNGAGYAVFGSISAGTDTVAAVTGAPCTAIPFFLPSGECTPSPNVVITSAVQTQ